jgi:hypothetical protein
MNDLPTISSALSQRSIRNFIGYALFTLCTIIPSVSIWQYGGDASQQPAFNRPQFGPRGGRFQQSPVDWKARAWWIGRGVLAVVGTTVAMMILLPHAGCKRFAVLFGPPTGLAAVAATAYWLTGRTEIYRVEPVLVGLMAAVPTGFLWVLCCQKPYERFARRQRQEDDDDFDDVEDDES